MASAISRFFRPYWDKRGEVSPRRLPGFLRQVSASTEESVVRWFPKVAWGLARGFQQHEVRFYRLHGLSWRTIATYHSMIENVRLVERINPADKRALLRDKGIFLKRFGHRIGRDWLDLREATAEAFAEFAGRHPQFIAKAYNLALGAGIEVFDAPPATEAEAAALYRRLVKEEKFVIEEFIRQHPALDAVYGRSVNTVRIYTLLSEGGAEMVLRPSVRFGSAGARIDSAGIHTVLVDEATGAFLCGAMNRKGEDVAAHPDTGYVFAELVVPWMAEAVALVKAAAAEIPEVRYIGWDVAITEGGPVLIEGNGAAYVVTLQGLLARHDPEKRGCRAEMTRLK